MSAIKSVRKTKSDPTCCPSGLLPGERPLLTVGQAAELMALFKVLANDTRLRMLHALVCRGELCVTGLADVLGMKPQAVSNQLQRLLDRGILGSRRQGAHVYYRIVNPCVTDLLDRGLCLIEDGCDEAEH
jgi:DNA-binding transcriptional ArsR family regulator